MAAAVGKPVPAPSGLNGLPPPPAATFAGHDAALTALRHALEDSWERV
jgi:hypothetical protein